MDSCRSFMLSLRDRSPPLTDFLNKGAVLSPHITTVQKEGLVDSGKGRAFSTFLTAEKTPQTLNRSGAHGQNQLRQVQTSSFLPNQVPDLAREPRSDAMADKYLHRLGYVTATCIWRHRHFRTEGKDLHPGNQELHGYDKMMHGAGIAPFIECMDQIGE